MFRFFDRNHEIGAGQVVHSALLREPIGAASDQIWRGKNDRLMINAPPGFLKSFLASVSGPAYVLGLNPRKRVMVASNTLDLAGDLSNACRRILTSDLSKSVFPGTEISRTKNTKLEVVTTAGGFGRGEVCEFLVGLT